MHTSLTAQPRPRTNILGVGVHALDLPGAVCAVEDAILAGTRGYVCVTSVHGIMEAQRDGEFQKILNHAFLITPDGMPTVWVGRIQGHNQMKRVFGPDLMLEICARAPHNRIRHFLYGGKPGVADELALNLRRRFPAIMIVGTFTPPFRELNAVEQAELEEKIEAVQPDIVWIGLSTPKQERFMAANCGRLRCKLMIGVGAAFDFHTGRAKDAPFWVKQMGLQWAHRMCQEPRRFWKRYLVNNPAFLLAIARQLTGLRHYSLPPSHAQITSPIAPEPSLGGHIP